MRKIYDLVFRVFLLAGVILSTQISFAQVSSYTFNQSAGTYTELTGGTVLGTATGNAVGVPSLDSEVYNLSGLPFSFGFNGASYNQIYVSSNGFITFGATAPLGTNTTPLSNTATYAGAVSAWGGDLNAVYDLTTLTGTISWEVVGTAPSREIVIQWKNFRPAYSTSITNAAVLNFQIRLEETTNAIRVVYGPSSHIIGSTNIATTRQVGLRGATNAFPANINNRTNTTGVSIDASTAGTANNSTQAFSSINALPGMHTNGKIYTWTPPACFAPSGLAITALTTTSVSYGWNAPSPAPDSFEYAVTTSATPPASGTSTIATTASEASLTPSTTYYIHVRSICGGTPSGWSTLSFFTGYCNPTGTGATTSITSFVTTNGIFNINNPSGFAAPGYADYTAQSVAQIAGGTVNFSLAYASDPGTRIWVDWNNNLVFDATEIVYQSGGYLVGPINSTITVPGAQAPGNYRMRIVIDWLAGSPIACPVNINGEIEDYTFTVLSVPSSPVLTQDPTPPTCSAGTNITAAGSPEVDVTWYWQTSATGTSTTQAYTGPYVVNANGTYYLRAYHAVYNYWAPASSIVISNFPLAPSAPTPVADVNPSCAPTGSQVSVPTAPVGLEYYWQTASGGTSNANSASTPLAVTSTSTVYVSTYETATQCWSSTSSLLVSVGTVTPGLPTVDNTPILACTGTLSEILTATAPPSSGSVTYTFGTNTSFPASTTITLTQNISLPVGATVTSATLTFNGVTTAAGSWPSDVLISMNGSATLGSQVLAPINAGVTNAGPYTFTPTITGNGNANLLINHTYIGTASAATITLTVNYTLPPASLTWFDAATGGNQLGSLANLETIGTSVLPTSTIPGTYSFYARSYYDGCYSASVEGTVSLADVNAVLNPVNVSCNGGNNGSFTLGTVECGLEPFQYSLDGGLTFGNIPTNLTAGTYSVIIEDDNGLLSSPISVVVTEPAAPSNITAININYFSADVTWTTTGNESSWSIEYGPAGFTPGTGTVETAVVAPYTLTGLTADTQYDVYVTAICGAGSVAGGPATFSTNPGFFTFDNACGPGFNDISGTATNTYNLGDDGEVGFTLPWTLSYQGTSVTDMTIGNNGGILFGTLTGALGFTNGAMNTAAAGLYPFWDDLGNTSTIYTQIVGTAPNRQAIFQWNSTHLGFSAGTPFVFQVVIDEATNEIYYIYDNAVTGSATYDYAANATIGAAGPIADPQVSFNNAAYLQNNSCVHFYNALCPNPTVTSVQTFQEDIILDWAAGPYGETEWTIIYGPAGFDPTTSGTTESGIFTSDFTISGLTQLTAYDIYIYSECTIDNLTSGGLLVEATTLPWCNTPTTLAGVTEVDSLFATWNWTPVAGATNALSGFNIQYGETGFDLYNGDFEVATGLDFADTIANPAFLAGGVYQVYVQAVCGVDTSNYAGPYTFVMPLSNDTVCGSEMLMADGTVYTFNNAGATVSLNENTIAPPTTGANSESGWINSTLNNTTWFTFVAPASGSVRVNNTAINYAGQSAVYDATDCSDFASFTLMAANDNSMLSVSNAPNYSVCGLTPGSVYYLMNDGNSATTGNYSISITPIVLEAGSFTNILDVCAGSEVNLFDGITGNDAGGVWSAEIAAAGTGLTDSIFNSSGLAYQIFNFEYRMTDGCAYDSIIAQVEIWAPSSAGDDGTIDVCRNEPFDLLSGLGGNVDMGGTWYNPSAVAMPSSATTASNIPGQFNYSYITGNGVCPNDTALVLVNVSSSCNYLDVEEMFFGDMTVFPNPSNGVFNIANEGSTEVFSYEVTDIEGRIIATKEAAINGTSTTEVDLTGKVTGVYMIRVYNDNAEKVFRVVLQ